MTTLADGLWMAVTTAATVSYSDLVPRTHASRGFAVIVLLLGLSVLSLATVSLAAIFVEKDVADEEALRAQNLLREINCPREDIRLLRDEVRQLRP